MISFMKESKL